MVNIFIPGGFGNHGQDLIKRGIFNGDKKPIIIPKDQRLFFPGKHAVIVPIRDARSLILRIINLGKKTNVIDFSGLLLNNQTNIANIHCLFGPSDEGKLNAVVTDTKNNFSLEIEEKLINNGINIHTLTPEVHDKKMAIIQGLTHLFKILLGLYFSENDEVKKLLLEWKTSEHTITDMLSLNSYFESIKGKALIGVIDGQDFADIFITLASKNLENGDIENFCTPSFTKLFEFFIENHGFILKNCDDLYDTIGQLTENQGIEKLINKARDNIKNNYNLGMIE